jgi:hypothetical protein
VDTVVTLCRGRETDEKHVSAEIYDAGDERQCDGDAKRMAGQSSLSLSFFEYRCSVCSARPFFYFCFFLIFFTNSNLGLNLKWPDLALDARRSSWSGDQSERAGARPQTHSALWRGRASHESALTPNLISPAVRSNPEIVWGAAPGATRYLFFDFARDRSDLCWVAIDIAASSRNR